MILNVLNQKYFYSLELKQNQFIFDNIYSKIKGTAVSTVDGYQLTLCLNKPEEIKFLKTLKYITIPN